MVGDQTVKQYFDNASKNLAHASDVATMLMTLDKATLKTGETPIVDGATGMKGYMQTEGAAALDGYLAAMNMVDGNVSNFDSSAMDKLLSEGYTSSDVVAILKNVMGK